MFKAAKLSVIYLMEKQIGGYLSKISFEDYRTNKSPGFP
jgi:hypothetical protein